MRNLFKIDSNIDKNNQMEIFYIEEDVEVQEQFDELFASLHEDVTESKKLHKECGSFCPIYRNKKLNKIKQK